MGTEATHTQSTKHKAQSTHTHKAQSTLAQRHTQQPFAFALMHVHVCIRMCVCVSVPWHQDVHSIPGMCSLSHLVQWCASCLSLFLPLLPLPLPLPLPRRCHVVQHWCPCRCAPCRFHLSAHDTQRQQARNTTHAHAAPHTTNITDHHTLTICIRRHPYI